MERPKFQKGRGTLFLAATVGIGLLGAWLLSRPEPGTQPVIPDPVPASAAPPTAAETSGFCDGVYRAVCESPTESRDPTGIVKSDRDSELAARRVLEELLRRHPDWPTEKVDEELARVLYTPRRRGRLTAAFSSVKSSLERFIERQPEGVFSAKEKAQLGARLEKLNLELPPPASAYADEPDLFTKSDVFYERLSNGRIRMRVGGAYLVNARSWYNLVFTMAHELAHAIDPCEMRAAGMRLAAYDRLSACFIREGLVPTARRKECGENDRLSEAFADWLATALATEALQKSREAFQGPQLLAAAINSVRDLCEEKESPFDPLDDDRHPPPQDRIERIFGAYPPLRQLLGCADRALAQVPAPYCELEPEPAQEPTPRSNP